MELSKTPSLVLLAFLGLGLTACKQNCDPVQKSSVSGASIAVNTSATSANDQCATGSSNGSDNGSQTTPDPEPKPPVTPPPTPPREPATEAKYPLLWEAKVKGSSAWSDYVYKVIREEEANRLMQGSDDMAKFCPRYNTLSNEERVNFWGLLISAITKYESAYSPVSRMRETTMGTDPVTGQPVYSEGLLQLSYQDTQWASYCEFDWSKDKNLSPTDPRKTILDPYKNLRCGIKIFARQVANKGLISVKSGAYWAVLIPGGKYTKVDEIAALTKKMPGCQ